MVDSLGWVASVAQVALEHSEFLEPDVRVAGLYLEAERAGPQGQPEKAKRGVESCSCRDQSTKITKRGAGVLPGHAGNRAEKPLQGTGKQNKRVHEVRF